MLHEPSATKTLPNNVRCAKASSSRNSVGLTTGLIGRPSRTFLRPANICKSFSLLGGFVILTRPGGISMSLLSIGAPAKLSVVGVKR